jgi:hypothetical protein
VNHAANLARVVAATGAVAVAGATLTAVAGLRGRPVALLALGVVLALVAVGVAAGSRAAGRTGTRYW